MLFVEEDVSQRCERHIDGHTYTQGSHRWVSASRPPCVVQVRVLREAVNAHVEGSLSLLPKPCCALVSLSLLAGNVTEMRVADLGRVGSALLLHGVSERVSVSE